MPVECNAVAAFLAEYSSVRGFPVLVLVQIFAAAHRRRELGQAVEFLSEAEFRARARAPDSPPSPAATA